MKPFRSLLLIGLAVTILPLNAAETVESRSKSGKNCAELLRGLLTSIGKDERLNKLEVRDNQVGQGYFFISKTGQTVHRPFGGIKAADLKFDEEANTPTLLKDLATSAAQRHEYVVVTGDVPLDKLVATIKLANLGPLEKHVFVTLDSDSPITRAKRRLLESKFDHVEIVVDMPPGNVSALFEMRSAVVGGVLPKSSKRVRVLTPDKLSGAGTFAEKLKASPPGPGVLRVSVAHHFAGTAHLSDGSTLPVADLYMQRTRDGGAECFLGCNLSYNPHQWFVYDGELFANDLAAIERDLTETLDASREMTGAQIIDTLAGQVLTGGNNPPPGGGGRPPGGSGGPPPGPDSQKSKRSGFRLLGIAAFATASQTVQAGDDDDDDEDEDKHPTKNGEKLKQRSFTDQGSFFLASLDMGQRKSRVGGDSPWFMTEGFLARLQKNAGKSLRERAVIYYDIPTDSYAFFTTASRDAGEIPSPLALIRKDAKPKPSELAAIKERAADFWFYVSSTPEDAIVSRQRLLGWQQASGVTMPFVFIPFESQPTLADWTLLKPFLGRVTHAGVSLPSTEAQAHSIGLFWCDRHQTAERLKAYTDIIESLASPNHRPENVDLDGNCAASLHTLCKNPEVNLWLIGVWNDRMLRRAQGDLENSSWVPSGCDAHAAFVSAYPVARPAEGKYFENQAHEIISKTLPKLVRSAETGMNFNEVEPILAEFVKTLQSKGGIIGISSCGRFLVISE